MKIASNEVLSDFSNLLVEDLISILHILRKSWSV